MSLNYQLHKHPPLGDPGAVFLMSMEKISNSSENVFITDTG